MDREIVSIIVPVYNTEKYLQNCIDSILKQTYKNIEVILINDGSKDNSLEICKKNAEKDERIILIDNSNHGVAYTRNMGIDRASGQYLMFVDSDDYIDEKYVERIHGEIIDSRADILISGYSSISSNRIEEKVDKNCILYDKKSFLKAFNRLRDENLIQVQCNKIIRSSIAKKYKENETYISGEDYLYNLDVLKDCELIKISDCTGYFYRDNQEGVSSNIRIQYTTHYELEHQINMQVLEKEKLIKLGFDNAEIDNIFGKDSIYLIKKVARNIAFYDGKNKSKKYKELLKNIQINEYINKCKNLTKEEKLVKFIYKTKSVIFMKMLATLLKKRALRRRNK